MNLRTMVWRMALATSAAISLQAHPGHAPFAQGGAHFATSSFHLGTALLFSLALCGAAQLLKKRGERNFVRAFAALIAVVAVFS